MQHFTKTSNLVRVGNTADSFARHFALVSQIENKNKKKFANKDVREMMRMSILWYGNPISCNKSFGKWNCRLCMKERLIILEEMRKGKAAGTRHLINSASELYGACRHRPSFHRYSVTQPTSTDEGHTSPEKSVSDASTSPPYSPPSPFTEDFNLVCREVGTGNGSFYERAVNTEGVSSGATFIVTFKRSRYFDPTQISNFVSFASYPPGSRK